MNEPNAVASIGTVLHSTPATDLCVCGLRASVRVWASECPSAPKRRVDESRQLCPRCAAIARGQPLPFAVRLEDLPPVAGPVHHKRPLAGRYAMTSRVLLALADGLRGETLRETTRATPKELRTVVSNLRKQGMVGVGYDLTTIGQGRVEQLRALLAEGGAP